MTPKICRQFVNNRLQPIDQDLKANNRSQYRYYNLICKSRNFIKQQINQKRNKKFETINKKLRVIFLNMFYNFLWSFGYKKLLVIVYFFEIPIKPKLITNKFNSNKLVSYKTKIKKGPQFSINKLATNLRLDIYRYAANQKFDEVRVRGANRPLTTISYTRTEGLGVRGASPPNCPLEQFVNNKL